ncbi:ABC transporter permease [Gaiella sp.]|uniref:ABC transporter permease n=1 Tax=Gaiella sp. TaxID=2663207 RepID=UPI002C58557C|nr:ABC transporter permease [Gaiella sp.]HWO81037.1 ABC transporter permease [Gaiella sp.]
MRAEADTAAPRRAPAREEGTTRSLALFLHELRMQQLMFWRNRESAVFVFIFPPMLFLLLGAVYDGTIDGVPAADRLLVGMIGYGCANTAFGGLAITMVIRREGGILKRLRATPLPAATYLAAVLVSTLFVFVLQMLVTVLLGIFLYDARGAESWPAVIPVVLLGGVAFAGLGFGAASLIRSAEGSSAVINLVILPMAFLSGSFGPTRSYPEVLQKIADVLPLTYLIDLLQAAYLHGRGLTHDLTAVGVLLAWGIAGYVVAAKRFGWQPRER